MIKPQLPEKNANLHQAWQYHVKTVVDCFGSYKLPVYAAFSFFWVDVTGFGVSVNLYALSVKKTSQLKKCIDAKW